MASLGIKHTKTYNKRGTLTDGVGGVGDDDVKLPLVFGHEVEAVGDEQIQFGVFEAGRHVG